MQDVHSHVHGGVSLRRFTPYTLWPLKGQRDVELGILESYSSCTIPVAPFGAWRHHLSPRFAVGLWVLGRGVNLHVEQQRRETVQPGLWPVGNAPLLVLTHHLSPGGGTLLYASLCANLSCSLHSAAREALIKSLSDFILAFLFNARNKSTRIASYLRRLMTQHWIKIHMKFDSAN